VIWEVERIRPVSRRVVSKSIGVESNGCVCLVFVLVLAAGVRRRTTEGSRALAASALYGVKAICALETCSYSLHHILENPSKATFAWDFVWLVDRRRRSSIRWTLNEEATVVLGGSSCLTVSEQTAAFGWVVAIFHDRDLTHSQRTDALIAGRLAL